MLATNFKHAKVTPDLSGRWCCQEMQQIMSSSTDSCCTDPEANELRNMQRQAKWPAGSTDQSLQTA
jgi:hypothetical protein